MYLSEKIRLPRTSAHTLRFKLTVWLALFLIVLLSAFIALASSLQWHFFRNEINSRLRFFIEEFESEYLSGEELKSSFHMTDVLPNTVTDSLATKMQSNERVVFAVSDSVVFRVFTARSADECIEYEINTSTGEIIVRDRSDVNRVETLDEAFNSESYGEHNENVMFMLFDGKRNLLARSLFNDDRLEAFTNLPSPCATLEAERLDDIVSYGTKMRVISRRVLGGNILVIGYSKDRIIGLLHSFFRNSIIAACIAVVFAISGGWYIAGRFSNGILRVAEVAKKIADGDYSLRIDTRDDYVELQRLVAVFNSMTNRTEILLNDLRTVADNIAHDLRTPLTRLSGKAELALYSNQIEDLPCDVQEECTAMINIINTMLEITQTENRFETARKADFDLAELLRQIADLFSTAAEDRGVTLELKIDKAPAWFHGIKVKLSRVVANLLDNALKFTPHGGRIVLALQTESNKFILSVIDTGCGIDPHDLPKVFDRFFRADSSRSLSGSGLGLSLAKAIVEAADGTIEVFSRLGKGTTFVVTLPRLV